MTNNSIPDCNALTDAEARKRTCLHQVYRYLVQLAAQKRAADRGEFGDLTRPAEIDTPAMEPKVQEKCTMAAAEVQVSKDAGQGQHEVMDCTCSSQNRTLQADADAARLAGYGSSDLEASQ